MPGLCLQFRITVPLRRQEDLINHQDADGTDARLVEELTPLLDRGLDLESQFEQMAADWRALVPGCTAAVLTLRDGGGVVLFSLSHDAADGSTAGHGAARTVTVPLATVDGLTVVLQMNLATDQAAADLLGQLDPLLGTCGLTAEPDDDCSPMIPSEATTVGLPTGPSPRDDAITVLMARHGGTALEAAARLRILAAAEGRDVAAVAQDLARPDARRP